MIWPGQAVYGLVFQTPLDLVGPVPARPFHFCYLPEGKFFVDPFEAFFHLLVCIYSESRGAQNNLAGAGWVSFGCLDPF